MGTLFHFLSDLYFTIIIVFALYFVILAASNIVWMRRHTRGPDKTEGPLVSVLVPARDEEENIRNCLESLLNQTYTNYEVLVLDDNSADDTYKIVREMAAKDPRLKIFRGDPLPEDWNGKPYALQQLSRKARGDILIFTDADTTHGPGSVSWAVTNIIENQVDCVSGYVDQEMYTFGEKITIPLMYLLTGFIIPLGLNTILPFPILSSALGQFIAVKTDVFRICRGFADIRQKTSDDVYFARLVKARGFRTMFLDAGRNVRCRMYTGYQQAAKGIGKNIFDFVGKDTKLLAAVFGVILIFLVLPFPLFIGGLFYGSPHMANLVLVNLAYTFTWLILFIDRRLDWRFAFLWPVFFTNVLYMAAWSWVRTVSGQGFVWKGRTVT